MLRVVTGSDGFFFLFILECWRYFTVVIYMYVVSWPECWEFVNYVKYSSEFFSLYW